MHLLKSNWKPAVLSMVKSAGAASLEIAQLSHETRKKILLAAASLLVREVTVLLRENAKDLKSARAGGLSESMIDRLTLTPGRIMEMAEGLKAVASLKDPIGCVESSWKRPNGLRISKVRVPIGVILIIYESRPNVTVECASLCLKSGNAVILRGGREAFYSNRALVSVFRKVLTRYRLPEASISFVEMTDRAVVDYLLKREKDIHLVIPRGGESLIRKVVRTSRIPVIKHYQGICHIYVDKSADIKKALAILLNAKLQRPGVCNAAETLLVHRDIASRFLPVAGQALLKAGCKVRADESARKWIPGAKAAKASDFGHEFLDKILAVRIVPDLAAGIRHIRIYGSAHTDAIVTQDPHAADIFKKRVDSASVMVNASTRFSDGFQFGFGAEIGISTDKIHARGPMGLEGLTSYKYIVEGTGQIRK